NAPNEANPRNPAMECGTIRDGEYAQMLLKAGTPEKIDEEPNCTGPFQFVNYQEDSVIRYKAFADYWAGKPKVDDLVFAITPDQTARWTKLQKNECQVMIGPNPADLPAMKKDKNTNLLSQPGLNVAYWAFNVQKPPFDKKEVRQALAMAIDKKAILKDVYQGTGESATTLIPSTVLGYNPDVKDYPYSPEKAKKMLEAAC